MGQVLRAIVGKKEDLASWEQRGAAHGRSAKGGSSSGSRVLKSCLWERKTCTPSNDERPSPVVGLRHGNRVSTIERWREGRDVQQATVYLARIVYSSARPQGSRLVGAPGLLDLVAVTSREPPSGVVQFFVLEPRRFSCLTVTRLDPRSDVFVLSPYRFRQPRTTTGVWWDTASK